MKNNKFIYFFVLAAVLFFTANIAYSDSYHGIVYEPNHQSTTNNYQIGSKGVALGYAFSGIDCNMSSDKWHGGVGGGFFDGVSAPAIGLCKRWGSTLIKSVVGVESSKKGANIGIMFNFE